MAAHDGPSEPTPAGAGERGGARPPAGLVIRPLSGRAAWEAHARLGVAAFQPDVVGQSAVAAAARRWVDQVAAGPEARTTVARGAFVAGRLAGGYTLGLRAMRLGQTMARTACIGNVVVDAQSRLRGVGRALMLDAVAEARRRRCAVVLLHGIADFYPPFGFVDVWDPERHALGAGDIARLPAPAACRVRPAGGGDGAALTRLYRRHFLSRYTGAFARSPALAAHRVRAAEAGGGGIHIATDRSGRVRGYLVLHRRDRHILREVVAEDRDAALALLHHHRGLVSEGADAPAEIVWEMPRDGLTFGLVADLLAVKSEVRRQEGAGWMARPGDPTALVRVAAAALGREAASRLDLRIDGVACPTGAADARPPRVEIAGTVFLALLFGHRSAAWAATRPGQRVPAAARPLLDAAAGRPAWIAGGDRF